MKKLVLVVIGLLLVAVAAVLLLRAKSARVNHEGLTLYGNVDIREVNLAFRVGGRIAELTRDEGDPVTEGQVLARLDDEPYRREVAEARSQGDALRARVQLLEAGNRPQEIAQARAVANERQVTSANAKRIYERQRDLLTSKSISIQEAEDSEARYREAEARLKSAQEQLALLEAGFRPEEIAQAKSELGRAEAALASAELRLQDTVLKASAGGVVITRAQEAGAIVQAGTTVFTVSLQQPVWARVYVHETELGKVHPGLKMQVFTDSRPDHPYSGQVGYISPRAEFTPKNIETRELRTSLVYRLRVVITDPDEALRQGMPVTVKAAPSGNQARQ